MTKGYRWQDVLGHRVELSQVPTGETGVAYWGTALWGTSLWGTGWAPAFSDVTQRCLSIHSSAGAEGLNLSAGVATLEVELLDLDGALSPGGDIDWLLGHHLRVWTMPAGKAAHPAAYGLIDKVSAGGTFDVPTVSVTAYDLRAQVAATLTGAPIADQAERTDVRLRRILDTAGLPPPAIQVEADSTPLLADDTLPLGDLLGRTIESVGGLVWADGNGTIQTRNKDWVYGDGKGEPSLYVYAGQPPDPLLPEPNRGRGLRIPGTGSVSTPSLGLPPTGLDIWWRMALEDGLPPEGQKVHLWTHGTKWHCYLQTVNGQAVISVAWASANDGHWDIFATSDRFPMAPGQVRWLSYTVRYDQAGVSHHEWWATYDHTGGDYESSPPGELWYAIGAPDTTAFAPSLAPASFIIDPGPIEAQPAGLPLRLYDLAMLDDAWQYTARLRAGGPTARGPGDHDGWLMTDDWGHDWSASAPAVWNVGAYELTDLEGLVALFDDQSVLEVAGTGVARWGNRAGLLADAIQGNATYRPHLTGETVNGRRVISFDRTGPQVLDVVGTAWPALATGMTVFVVVITRGPIKPDERILSFASPSKPDWGDAGSIAALVGWSETSWGTWYVNATVGLEAEVDPIDVAHVLCLRRTGDLAELWIDDQPASAETGWGWATLAFESMRMGGAVQGGDELTARLGAVVVSSTAVSESDRIATLRRLQADWATPATVGLPVAQTTDLSASEAISTVRNQVLYANRAEPPVEVTRFDAESIGRYGARKSETTDLACDQATLELLAARELRLHSSPVMVCEGATVTVYDEATALAAAVALGDVIVVGRNDPDSAAWEITGIVAGIDLDITPESCEVALTVTETGAEIGAARWGTARWDHDNWSA